MNDPKAYADEGLKNTMLLKKRSDNPLELIPAEASVRQVKKASIIGFGTMGTGIAADILRHTDIRLVVKDTEPGLEKGMALLAKTMKALKVADDSYLERITATASYGQEFADVDLVIEAVFEQYELKQQVYGELCQVVSPECIIASNTSTIPITYLSKGVTNPARFIGAHFFSPVPRMELLEIIKGESTSPQTVYDLIAFAAAIKKRPLICKDSPGFVVNALLLPYFQKAFWLLEHGVPIEAIDGAMVKMGMPVGPIRLVEEVGIDVPYNAFRAMGLTPPKTIENMVKNGRLGFKKSGKGFFTREGTVDTEAVGLINVEGTIDQPSTQDIQDMLFRAFVEKGKELLDNKVVDDVRDIDMGTIWGLGFPPNTGGPMKLADLTGLSQELFQRKFYQD